MKNLTNKSLLFGYTNSGDLMEDKTIEVIVKETDSERNDFPNESSDEGKKMIQTVREETISSDK